MAVFFKTGKIMRNSLHWMLDDGEQASTEAKHLVGMVGNGGGHYGCGGAFHYGIRDEW
jgi:hypothetical protein